MYYGRPSILRPFFGHGSGPLDVRFNLLCSPRERHKGRQFRIILSWWRYLVLNDIWSFEPDTATYLKRSIGSITRKRLLSAIIDVLKLIEMEECRGTSSVKYVCNPRYIRRVDHLIIIHRPWTSVAIFYTAMISFMFIKTRGCWLKTMVCTVA